MSATRGTRRAGHRTCTSKSTRAQAPPSIRLRCSLDYARRIATEDGFSTARESTRHRLRAGARETPAVVIDAPPEVTTVSDYVDEILAFTDSDTLLLRGHGCASWTLVPKLGRVRLRRGVTRTE